MFDRYIELNNGVKIPQLGLGTWFIDDDKVADAVKEQVTKNAERLAELEKLEAELGEKVKKIMMIIPNIIDPSVPIGKDDSENVEIQKYGEPFVPDFEVPYHTEI